MTGFYLKYRTLIFVGVPLLILGVVGLGLFFTGSDYKNLTQPVPTPVMPTPKVVHYQVPILMYHYIRNADGENRLGQLLSVSPENFDLQMQFLKTNNYQTMTLADFADPNHQKILELIAEGKKPVIVTFDDGYVESYTNALPILQKYNFIGTFFVIRDFTGLPRYLTADEIAQMKTAGMEIGSHTLDHVDLSVLASVDQELQIAKSKEDAQVFCYPFGKLTDITVGLVKSAGYLDAVTTQEGIANQSSDLFRLPRLRITNVPLEKFQEMLEGRTNGTNPI